VKHVATPEPFPTGVTGPVAQGDARSLPHREAGLEPGTRGDTGAFLYRVASPVACGT
jgi:hypothetical protein